MSQQLTLSVALRDDARFANFYAKHNEAAVFALQQFWNPDSDWFVYLYGPAGVGCSYLLQASCHLADGLGHSNVYLPLDELQKYGPHVLDDLEQLSLVAIDHVDAVIGQPEWEEALFYLFNRMKDSGKRLLISAKELPSYLGCYLPDLESRLKWGVTYQIHDLNDEEKAAALLLRAEKRGLALSEDVAKFLLTRVSRNMSDILNHLDLLDRESLREQRKITIPFVKETLKL